MGREGWFDQGLVRRELACLLVVLLSLTATSDAASDLEVARPIRRLWDDLAFTAAEKALQHISKTRGLEYSLRDVLMDTLQVHISQQHQIGLTVDGITYDFSLGDDVLHRSGGHKALPLATGRQLVPVDWDSLSQQSLALPEVVLTGPLELILSTPGQVQLFTPNSVDMGTVRGVRLAAGASVKVAGMKAITLRRPVELPRLPPQYVAETMAHAMLGEPEPGYENAPGVMYLARALQRVATNASTSSATLDAPLLSFTVEAAGALTLSSESLLPDGAPPPRLKVKRLKNGLVELGLRPGEVDVGIASSARSLALRAATWAWPLPHLRPSDWLPYETLLRSVLLAHPLNLPAVAKEGVALQLTHALLRSVRLVAVDVQMRVTGSSSSSSSGSVTPAALGGAEEGADGEFVGFQDGESELEVWHVLAALHDPPPGSSVPDIVPLTARRKAVYGSTLTMSDNLAELMLLGNRSVPLGFESQDLGYARNA